MYVYIYKYICYVVSVCNNRCQHLPSLFYSWLSHIFCLPVANWDGSTQLPTTWTAGTGMAVGAESVEVI